MEQIINYKWMTDEFYKKADEQLLQMHINRLKDLDSWLLKNRDKKYKVKDFQKRTIFNPKGLLKIKRGRYLNTNTNKYEYLLDDFLGWNKGKFVVGEYRDLALKNYCKYNSYQKIADEVFEGHISKSTVCQLIKDTTINYEIKERIDCKGKTLYLNTDGIFIKKNAVQSANHIKTLLCFTNNKKNWKEKERHHLIDRRVFFSTSSNHEDLHDDVMDFLDDNYFNYEKIFVVGDGARWIKLLARSLKAKFCIDTFHVHKAIRDIRAEKYLEMMHIFRKNLDHKTKRTKMLKLAANKKTGEITKTQIQLIGYVLNNFNNYKRTIKNEVISCVEGIQAHYISSNKKNVRKGFNEKTLVKLLTYDLSLANHWKVLFNKEKIQEEYGTNLWNKETGNLPMSKTGRSGWLGAMLN